MIRAAAIAFSAVALLFALAAPAASASSGSKTGSGHHTSHATHTTHASTKSSSGVGRDKHGKIARSQSAKNQFKKSHPCPSTGKSSGACPGYVIDHVKPLKRGGADRPANMQWQTTRDAKEKDKWE